MPRGRRLGTAGMVALTVLLLFLGYHRPPHSNALTRVIGFSALAGLIGCGRAAGCTNIVPLSEIAVDGFAARIYEALCEFVAATAWREVLTSVA